MPDINKVTRKNIEREKEKDVHRTKSDKTEISRSYFSTNWKNKGQFTKDRKLGENNQKWARQCLI